MIPAERCALVIFGSAIDRARSLHPLSDSLVPMTAPVEPLESHGVDEVECGWEGDLPVQGYETPTTFHAEGECPRCGQVVVVRGTD